MDVFVMATIVAAPVSFSMREGGMPSTSFLFALGFGVVSYVIGGIFFIKNKL
jgi:predicted membrane channel-forming protein YqfA (hemolysin III family)